MSPRYRGVPAPLLLSTFLVAFITTPLFAPCAHALDAQLLRENHLENSLIGAPCPLEGNTNGSAANLRWYNICSGYLWLYGGLLGGEAVGVRFGGPEQPEVNDNNFVKRAITYFRNVTPGYGRTVNVYVDGDANADGCPDIPYLTDSNLDPGLRWNCSEFDAPIPANVTSLIIRTQLLSLGGPSFATDGPFSAECDPFGAPRSFYYPRATTDCFAWDGPTDRNDNFLYWLIVDDEPANAAQPTSWGRVKGLYR